jgi:nucleotide-binding universal stress UspA family protein
VTVAIVHATDLTGDDVAAFHHAAALAAASGAPLVTLHGTAGTADPSRLPDAAPLAARWGRAIAQERLCHECCDDAADTVLDAIRRIGPRLIVAGTHARHGLAALVAESVAEAVARNAAAPTLIVPNHVRGFVDPATGGIDLQRVLVPAATDEDAARGREAAHALAALAGTSASIEVLHVPGGGIADAIVNAARTRRACAIVMTTRGHDGLGDALFGSHTERVIRDVDCPVLVVPTGDRGSARSG